MGWLSRLQVGLLTSLRHHKLISWRIIVKQNCCWKIVVRRMQGVRSIASINLYAEDKERFLFAYDAPMTFQIHFCLTIIGYKMGHQLQVYGLKRLCVNACCRSVLAAKRFSG